MPTIKQLEEQGRALLANQKALVEDESRPWSEKRAEFDKIDADIKAVLEQHKAAKSVDGDPFKAADLGAERPAPAVHKSLGEQVTSSENYKRAVSAKSSNERFGVSFDLDTKVAGNILETGVGAGGLVPTYLPGVVPTLFRRLTVSDLIPQGTMSSASLIYVQETATTNGAATVAEGALKPQSDLTLSQVTENARKIATVAKISDEMLQDVQYIESYVNGRLVLFVQLAEEDQLLNGNGTAPNLTGLLNRTGLQPAQAVGTDTRVDAIFKEITKIRANAFLEPDAVVLNPTDWQSIRLLKDANGQYYGGGPFGWSNYGQAGGAGAGSTSQGMAGSEALWGVRVVVTPAIAAGTALVGAFSTGAQIFRRTGITVEMTNSNEDDFKTNLVAIRAEERLGLAVYRPGAFGTVTGL